MKSRFVLFISVLLFSCGNSSQNNTAKSSPDWVMTRAIQEKLTPDSIITILKNGNTNFYNFKLTPKNDSLRIRITSDSGQYPMAAVLSCLDSRVPPEHVFDRGIGTGPRAMGGHGADAYRGDEGHLAFDLCEWINVRNAPFCRTACP